ncbi:NifB/NifX family molybdenum-iron cluster-binding protein [Ferroplasma acidiphilum]|uniref:Diguanylate cyclase n=1 Tax=Ferroplasma acidiphilum TaxID=74969 RepID=A0A7K4FPP6_9ARCH|nr:NifB/NifX family molybdenum-iron cluster-binding protein [Ferroplasma acidiphilum]NOL61006.1 diguanylate cyclase [Ferroplasma acidiphilum]
MTNKVGLPVNGSNVSGPGEGAEIHIFEVEHTKYKLVESYENPAIKATTTRGIHMLKSVLSKHVDAIIVSEIGAPGVNFLKNKIKIYYANNMNENEAMEFYINSKLEEIAIATHESPHHDGNTHKL